MTDDFLVDVHGLRTFRVSDDGHLLPVTAVDDSWRDGVCIAKCRRDSDHRAPADDCRCGVYSFRHLPVLRAQYQQSLDLVAVVALEGQTLQGAYGWRSQAARVLDIWVSPEAIPAELRERLAANLPDVRFHDDVLAMVAAHPDLSVGPPPVIYPWGVMGVPTSPTGPFLSPAAVRIPLARRPPPWPVLKLRRIPAYVLGTALFAALFVAAFASADLSHLGSIFNIAGSAIERAGAFLALNSQNLLFPLLLIGMFLQVHVEQGRFAMGLGWFLRVAYPVFGGVILAAIIVPEGHPIALSMPATALNVVVLVCEIAGFVANLGRMVGTSGAVARGVLRAAHGWRRHRTTGVNYSGALNHQLTGYPLVLPVHFEPS